MGFLDETGLDYLKSKMDSKYSAITHTHNYAAGWESSAQILPADVGWYRVATSDTNNSIPMGTFYITGNVLDLYPTVVTLNAGYNGTNQGKKATLIQTACSQSSSSQKILTKARIVYKNRYAYLEVYHNVSQPTTISVKFTGTGWQSIAPNTAGSIPDGYASKEMEFEGDYDTIVGNLLGRADSAWDADYVQSTATNPSSATSYYIPFHNNNRDIPYKDLYANNGLQYYTKEGTASAVGKGELGLGNNVASGTAGNKTGGIFMYGNSTGYTYYYPFCNTTSNYTRYLVGTASPGTAVGSATQPTYVSSDGAITACTSYANATVDAATKLSTARTIRTNLGSTSTASFNGTANVTPGVTGTLPVANGGTGAVAKGTTLLSNIGITSGTADPPATGTAGTIYIKYS